MAEDIPGYPPTGRPLRVSNEVLSLKIDNYMDQTERESRAMHGHLTEVLKRVDELVNSHGILRDTVLDHNRATHHEGTREELVSIRKDILDQEKAIGQLMTWKAVSEGKWGFADKLWLVAIAAVPTSITAYIAFIK